jgi:DUF1126 PH-like domain
MHYTAVTPQFVLTYDLSDDTLSVFELRQKNSGRQGGPHLAKGRYQRCEEPSLGSVSRSVPGSAPATSTPANGRFFVPQVSALIYYSLPQCCSTRHKRCS